MGKKACGSNQNPDDWDLVDDPEQDSSAPVVTLPNWRKLARFLLVRAWARGEWSDLGKQLQKLKARGKIVDPPPASSCHCGRNHPRGPEEPPPDGGASGTVVWFSEFLTVCQVGANA